MEQLHALAQAAGVAREWTDVDGRQQMVADDALAAVLAALGHEAGSARQIARSLAAAEERRFALPPMLVADCGASIPLPFTPARAEATGEDGITRPLAIVGNRLTAPDRPGYYDLVLDGRALKLAVAPAKCPLPNAAGRRPWGVSLQIPALRGAQPSPFGTFGDLAEAAQAVRRGGRGRAGNQSGARAVSGAWGGIQSLFAV